MIRLYITLGFIFLCCSLQGGLKEEILEGLNTEGITVNLRNPVYTDGVLCTEEGGVIEAPKIRIQAQRICFTQRKEEEENVLSVIAEDQIIVSFGQYIFTGDRLEYDFVSEEGVVFNGRSAIEPWYFGGEKIYLYGQDKIRIDNGYVTTSESDDPDWAIRTNTTIITCEHVMTAWGVEFHFFRWPLFWLPKFKINLDSLFDSPIRYRIRWGGKQGLRFGMIYEVFDWNSFKTFLRFDYRIQRGPGGGIETHYESPYKNHWFHTINYIANDSSIDDPSERTRYRLEGAYHNEWDCGHTGMDFSYDFLSDKEMPTDYDDNGLHIDAAQRTQLNFRRQEDQLVVANFFTRVRINEFQTIKQELPSITTIFHPLTLGCTGIISDNKFKMGYFDFKYANDEDVANFHAWRCQFFNRIYRPIQLNQITVTPQAEGIAILYGSSPQQDVKWLLLGRLGGEAKTSIYRCFKCLKHVVEPYISYNFLSDPTIDPNEHFIFDITDGWFDLNALRFGARQLVYVKPNDCYVSPYLVFDLYSYAFTNTPTIPKAIPKIYADFEWHPSYYFKHKLTTAWDNERNALNYINYRIEATLSDTIAFSCEYRQRSSYWWRKVRYDNFILDSFRTEQQLRNSLVSDQRNTVLAHLYARLEPNWATQFIIRHGWNRLNEPSYTEYECDLILFLRASWAARLSYQKREGENRFTVYFTLGGDKPRY
ncbi:MAG: hypothetical protein K940chlam3_00607 [Chlamydiae bacterium]|nr:hypothetical protein [Chlamydiota bacterium]